MHGSAPSTALPTGAERAAGRLAALTLADRPDAAAEALEILRSYEDERRSRDEPPIGLLDNALDLLYAEANADVYAGHAARMLETGDPDPELRRRLENYLEAQPLQVAERRLSEYRRRRIAAIFNRIVQPLSRFITGGALNPIESGRALIASLLIIRRFPEATTQERQALRAYQDFLDRYPDSDEAPRVMRHIAHYQRRLDAQLRAEAMRTAETALDAGFPRVALSHLDRARRLGSSDASEAELRRRADADLAAEALRVRTSLSANAAAVVASEMPQQDGITDLASSVLYAPASEIATRAEAWRAADPDAPLADEARFLVAMMQLELGEEDAFFEQMSHLASASGPESNMARHAAQLLADPAQNPYAAFHRARGTERRRLAGWLALGSRMGGPLRRDLWRPLEWLIDLPGIAVSVVTMPLRLLQISSARARFGGGVIQAGERYVSRFPGGVHAEEIRRQLEQRYSSRQLWSHALAHHRSTAEPDGERIARYRERIAERTLASAELHPRPDIRAAIYRSVAQEYADIAQGAQARVALEELLASNTPQHIRLSKEFLEEHPEVWGPGTLGLRAELLDGDAGNGELAEEGVTLIGRTFTRVHLAGREPVVERLPAEQFARFIARLEEARYSRLAADDREQPAPDPQRDLFFERARLGLLDAADLRPAATSRAVFLGSREKFGWVRRRASILPVEVVVQGGLEDFGISAFPRILTTPESADAFLYR